jgi:hypothetical protein
MNFHFNLSEEIKNIADLFSLGTAIAVYASLIPVLVGTLTIIWAAYRVYDLHLSVKLKKQKLKEQ